LRCSSHFTFIFLYNEDLYISKQYSSKSGSKALFFTRNFACGKPRRNEAPLSGCVADAVLSSWSKPEMMKLIQSKQILLLSTWQKQLFIFNDTFFTRFAGKRSGPHTKISNRIISLNFSNITNRKRSESLCGIFPIH
jgi:hypothetical protein